MALQTEEHEQFKICGLCSQLVDESVLINAGLKSFLLELLVVTENALPEKTCLECYKSAIECKRFKEACKKSINKLEQKNISSSMILGKSEQQSKVAVSSAKAGKNDTKSKSSAADSMKNLKNATTPSKKNKILESLGLDPDKIDIGVELAPRSSRSGKTATIPVPSTPVSTKSTRRSDPVLPAPAKSKSPASAKKKSSTGDGTQKCHVVIKKVDRKVADELLEQLNVIEVQKILGKTPSKASKRGRPSTEPELDAASIAATPPPAKRGRRSAPEPVVATPTPTKVTPKQTPSKAQKTPNKATPPPAAAATAATPTGAKNRSSFGRVRNTTSKSGYVYGEDMDTSTDPIEVEPEPEPTPPPPPSASKRGKPPPPKAAAAATPNKKPKPNNKQEKQKQPEVEVVEEEVVEVEPGEDEDMEEVFPTIGPYQCEICQIITDTKVEFVDHIESKHADVVDEEVLLSLKSDIRKSKKKNGAPGAPAPPASAKKAPAPAAKKSPAPPAKKAPPSPPKPIPKPSPSKKAAKKTPSKQTPPPPAPKSSEKARGRATTQGPASRTPKKFVAPPAPKPAAVPNHVNSPPKEKNHSKNTAVSKSSPSENSRHRQSTAKKRKETAVPETDPLGGHVEDPLGGLEPVAEVVLDNAEEDMQPQQQEDNSDEHSSTASNAKPMAEITNGHHNNSEAQPKGPAFNFWDDVPAEEYAAHQPKAVVVEPIDRTPIEFPF
jgi:hypothetical protein